MSERGGLSYDTLYPCVCLIDRIAESMSYDEFAEAQVFAQLRSTPGERGGVFRDPDQAETLTAKLESAQEEGESSCFVGDTERRSGGARPNAAPRNVRPVTPRQTPPAAPRDATPTPQQEAAPENSSDARAATASPEALDGAHASGQERHRRAAALGEGR